jgi:hypothetical protein
MQPGLIATLIVILPLLASNGAFLLSANAGHVPWCLPYIDGCSTISQAGRSGQTIFYYRALVFPYGILLMLFWVYTLKWLDALRGHRAKVAYIIFWLGMIGSIGLLVYIDFLGAEGEFNSTMRRTGAALYFVLIPLAQSLLLYQHYKLILTRPKITVNRNVLQYQFGIILLMLMVAIASVIFVVTDRDSYVVQNIVEWNFSLLINLYSAGMVLLWKDYRQSLVHVAHK